MHIICILVVLYLNVSYGHELYDGQTGRKWKTQYAVFVPSEKKVFQVHLQMLEFFVFIYNFILMDMNKNQMRLTFNILSKQEDT